MFEEATLSRRILLQRAGALAAVGAAGLYTGGALGPGITDALAAPAAFFSDDFANVADGPLDGRVAGTGHKWIAYGANGPPLSIGRRSIGAPAGFRPPATGTAAGYGSVDLGGTANRVGAQYFWDPSTSAATGLALGAFDYGTAPVPGGGPAGSNMHLAITPTFLQFAVFSRGAANDFTVLIPRGGRSGTVNLPKPQARDGRTVYQALIHLTGDVARVDLTGLSAPLYFQDPRIASVAANNPFFEYYATPGGTNLPRFKLVAGGRA